MATGLGHHRLLLAVTDCVWCTVVGNPVVEDIFLEEGGVFCLLDLLQVVHSLIALTLSPIPRPKGSMNCYIHRDISLNSGAGVSTE